ncbi:hypothetical protein FI667_g15282, partial [Globisporangium splendens]
MLEATRDTHFVAATTNTVWLQLLRPFSSPNHLGLALISLPKHDSFRRDDKPVETQLRVVRTHQPLVEMRVLVLDYLKQLSCRRHVILALMALKHHLAIVANHMLALRNTLDRLFQAVKVFGWIRTRHHPINLEPTKCVQLHLLPVRTSSATID